MLSTQKMDENTTTRALLEKEVEDVIKRTTGREAIQKLKDLLLENFSNSETRFKTIFEESSFGNKIISADLKIIKVNAALTKLLGYSSEELIGTLITDIADPDYVEDWKKLQNVLWSDKKTSFSTDTCLLKKDRSQVYCHVTSIVFKDNHEDFGYTIIEDITDRHNYERIRSELDAKKDEFIGIVSHELKTPLTTLKAINQLLEKAVSKDQTYYTFIARNPITISHVWSG
jgi:two-component system sensor histidine kinase VicK